MEARYRNLLSIVFSLAVIALAAFVMQRFFLPLAWAAILCIAAWPLYRRLLQALGNRPVPAALLLTLAIAAVFVIPALFGIRQAVEQAPNLAAYIANANDKGIPPPQMLSRIPKLGSYIHDWWLATLAQPHGLAHLVSGHAAGRMHSASEIMRLSGARLFHRLIDFGFALLSLFFFFKDGDALQRQLTGIGTRWFGERRWQRYAERVPTAIRGTVNGLVLVGLGEGVLIGIGYAVAGLPSPALWGAATGFLAIIPFGAPLVYLIAAAMLAVTGKVTAAIGVAAWGSVVLFIADHFIRPKMIGDATRLPFLAVLFGILGGVETLGLVGLFIGPVVMVLFITLWHEAKSPE